MSADIDRDNRSACSWETNGKNPDIRPRLFDRGKDLVHLFA
jgi:hypothetical protein